MRPVCGDHVDQPGRRSPSGTGRSHASSGHHVCLSRKRLQEGSIGSVRARERRKYDGQGGLRRGQPHESFLQAARHRTVQVRQSTTATTQGVADKCQPKPIIVLQLWTDSPVCHHFCLIDNLRGRSHQSPGPV